MSDSGDWRDHARCAGLWGTFFPPHNERPKKRELREARCKTICATCPVQDLCLEDCLSRGPGEYPDIVAGGLTEVERLKLMGSEKPRYAPRAI